MRFNVPTKGQLIVLKYATIIKIIGGDFLIRDFEDHHLKHIRDKQIEHFFPKGTGFEIKDFCQIYRNSGEVIELTFINLPNPSKFQTGMFYDGKIEVDFKNFQLIDFEMIDIETLNLYNILGHDQFYKQIPMLKEEEILII